MAAWPCILSTHFKAEYHGQKALKRIELIHIISVMKQRQIVTIGWGFQYIFKGRVSSDWNTSYLDLLKNSIASW